MNLDYILSEVSLNFTECYSHFKEFAIDERYKPFWDLCMQTISNRDELMNIRFCNDMYQIPPVRVFVDINRRKIEEIRANDFDNSLFNDNGLMNTYLKQSLGAFWGMVFKFGMNYPDRKSVSMVKDRYYGIQTASRFYFSNASYDGTFTIE